MLPLEQLHPVAVHFPIVLTLSLAVLDIIAYSRGVRLGGRGAYANLSAGIATAAGLFALVAFFLGDAAIDIAISRKIDPAILETHQDLGMFTAFALAAWGALRAYAWWRKIDLSANRAYLVLAVEVAFVFLILTVAYFGGQLVYDFGVNVAPALAKP
ncbi:MAG: DUF2231 domain-containing protein [Rhodobacteraceae bacterium]|nr:DUF2231 domain-containing protein [Paracoccaceae bacterium]